MAQITIENITVKYDVLSIVDDGTGASTYTVQFRVSNANTFDIQIASMYLLQGQGTSSLKLYTETQDPEVYIIPAGAVDFEITHTYDFGATFPFDMQQPIDGQTVWKTAEILDIHRASYDTVTTQAPQNTGYKAWAELEEYYLDDNSATGNTKPNVDTDPDYVAPVYDTTACPLP